MEHHLYGLLARFDPEWAERAETWVEKHRRALKWTAWLGGIFVVLPLILLFLLPFILMPFSPHIDPSMDLYAANRPVAYTFIDAHGAVAGRRGAIVGERLKLEDMPPYLPAAFIAMEDRRFYHHGGIDSLGLLRALLIDLRARRVVAGGSSISQQTAKIVFTNSERSFSRKLSDMLGALALEKALTKKQILELYLNRIYLGAGAYGVDGAAHVYFGKSARKLTLSEAAMLATLTTAPSVFSPRRDLARAQARASRVLSVMADQDYITEGAAEEARAHPASMSDRTFSNGRNFYLDAAADEVERRAKATGEHLSGDLVVYTTLEPRIQDAATKAARTAIQNQGKKLHAGEAAAVVMRPDGGVAALVGGTDYAESPFNRATQAHRQPGSSFKPFVYLVALESGMTPWDEREDQPVDIDGWTPTNFGGHDYGTLTLTDALAHSVNTVTAALAQQVGIRNVIAAAHRCGIGSPLKAHASLALGTAEVTLLEMTDSYATFASGGLRVRSYFVTGVTDGAGHVLYRRVAGAPERVVGSHVARDLNAMLYAVVTQGTGGRAGIWTHEAAGKTGTTQDYHDAWFVGFTADYVAGVWVGNDDSSPMKGVTGGSLPADIWKKIMYTAELGLPARAIDRSPPYMPVDTDMMASGVPGVDDEAPTLPKVPAQNQTQKKETHKGFWNWLFGSDDKESQESKPSGQSDEAN
jgi:penicillin-binding protein 1A